MKGDATVVEHAAGRRRPLWLALSLALLTTTVLLVLAVIFFPWDWLREPLNRYVSERTGRHFEITRKLDVKLGRTTRILADGIQFANPDWALEPYFVKAESAVIDVQLLPLLRGHIVLPVVQLHKPTLGLQLEQDGRRSWALGRDTSDPSKVPQIGALVVDEGTMHYVAKHHGADIQTEFTIEGNRSTVSGTATVADGTGSDSAPQAQRLPLSFRAKGAWKGQAFAAHGRTGNVLYLSAPLQNPFPIELDATAGKTLLRASGTIASLATLDGADASFSLQGYSLAELYKLVGVVLPETPRYAVRGHLAKQGKIWRASRLKGKLGNTDLSGELSFDGSYPVGLLTGKLTSKSLDFDDLAPLVGLPERPRSAAAVPAVARPAAKSGSATAAPAPTAPPTASVTSVAAPVARPRPAPGKVLPVGVLDAARLRAMNADVQYSAARIAHARQLPLDRMSVQVRVNDGVLRLDPMTLGIAGGTASGRIQINGNSNPALAEVTLDARSLELNRLFPGIKLTRASFGKIHGKLDLKGRGNSVAHMLGTSSGDVALLMGRGQISNLLMEIAGLDGGEIIKFMLRGDRNIELRCAAAAFRVNRGLMTSRTLMLDTADTVFYGDGQISLATETMDLTLRPYPKDVSILSLRSPLKVSGSWVAPKAGPDTGALTGRAGLALALGAINPLLALAATIETGPGRDADCGAALREAASPAAAARIAATAPPPAPTGTALGGAPTPKGAAAPSQSGPHYPLDKAGGQPKLPGAP